MLYLFTGNNRYLITQEIQKWKHAFGAKYGEENVSHIPSLEVVSSDFLAESLLSRSLFSEKRLVIIDWFPYSGERSFSWAADIEKTLIDSLDYIPEETLVVFASLSPDKRKSSYKTLSKLAEVKEFSTAWEDQVVSILQQKFSSIIEYPALQRLVYFKWWDLQKSISELEKLMILFSQDTSHTKPLSNSLLKGERTSCKITREDVENYIIPEFEESIFVFIDTLLSKNPEKIFSEFENLLNFSNFYAVYQSIIGNLRVFLYIEHLKSQKKSPHEIGDILKLWNRQFLIKKSYKANFSDINSLYTSLLNFDKDMKFGKLISSDEKDLQKEIERVFLRFMS